MYNVLCIHNIINVFLNNLPKSEILCLTRAASLQNRLKQKKKCKRAGRDKEIKDLFRVSERKNSENARYERKMHNSSLKVYSES